MKNIRKNGILLIYFLILLMALVTCMMMHGAEWTEIALNLLFLGIMAVLILLADKSGIQVMEKAADECGNLGTRISELSADVKGENLWRCVKDDLTLGFTDPVIHAAWERYRNCRLPGNPEQYVGEELIYERGKKELCDMIPALLTALGILGTFLGLIISMRAMSFGSMDALEVALESIVGGINVAFYTSVYGVLLSILYNLIYKGKIQYVSDKIYGFHEMLRRELDDITDLDTDGQILKFSGEQKEILERIEEALKEDMAKRMGEVVGEAIRPAFEEINQSLKRVIGDFREEQSASLQNIVASFIEQMRDALDSHINELGMSVDRLSRSQEEMTKKLKALLEEIENTASDTRKINLESGMILEKFEEYLDKINSMIDVTQKTSLLVEQYTLKIHQTVQEQGKVVSGLEYHEQKLAATCEEIRTIQNDFTFQAENSLKIAADMQRQQKDFMEEQEKVLRVLENYGQKMFDTITVLKNGQFASAQEFRDYRNTLEASQKSQDEKWERMCRVLEAMEHQETIQGEDKIKTDAGGMYSMGNLVRMQMHTNQLLTACLEQMEEERKKKIPYRIQSTWRKISGK